jgi:hypothetical protein
MKSEMSNLKSQIPHFRYRFVLLLSLLSLSIESGCVADNRSRPLEQRVTYVPKENAEPAYFLSRPAVASVTATDFDALWKTIYRVTRDAGFLVDLEDHRLGIFNSRPLVSSQWFEPWRHDTGSLYGRLASSLATLRRTVRWQVTKNADGTFAATPKVLVERYSLLEHRITSNAEYTEVFLLTLEEQRNQRLRALDPASFAEAPTPAAYWYAVGRDEALEQRLAENAKERVGS